MSYCKLCGSYYEEGAVFCPGCGEKVVEEIARENVIGKIPQEKYQGMPSTKKNKIGIVIGIGIAVGLLVMIIFFALILGGDDNGDTNVIAEKSEVQELGKALELYQVLQENEAYPYTLTSQAEIFLEEHENFFPTKNTEELAPFTDIDIEYKHLDKNIDRYGDKLFCNNSMYVLDISEESISEDIYLTAVQALDEAGDSFIVFYRGELPDVFEEDTVSVYGLPIGLTTFENIGGGSTKAVVLAGCSVRDAELDLAENLMETPEKMITTLGLEMKEEEGEIGTYYQGYDGGLAMVGQKAGELRISLYSAEIGMSIWGIKPGMNMEDTLQNLKNDGHKIYYYLNDNYFCMMEDYKCLQLIGDGSGNIIVVSYEDSPLKTTDFGPKADSTIWEGVFSGYNTASGIYLFGYNPDYLDEEFVYFSYGYSELDIDRRDLKAYWTTEYDNVVDYEDDSIQIRLCFLWDGSIKIDVQSAEYGLSETDALMKDW